MNLPVESISWDEAVDFCVKLTEKERAAGRLPVGLVYRLPTEAEWEYACRAGTDSRFSFGDCRLAKELQQFGWYSGNSGKQTHTVGKKLPNGWGLYDMHGNVWEWCLDWIGKYAGGNASDPKGPSRGEYRVCRGGGWRNHTPNCRSANRGSSLPPVAFFRHYCG